MADYRCPNCGGFPGHEKDCVGVLGNTCAACKHSLHSAYIRSMPKGFFGSPTCGHVIPRSLYLGTPQYICECVDGEKSELDVLNEERIWV